jgi:hypothetical protein
MNQEERRELKMRQGQGQHSTSGPALQKIQSLAPQEASEAEMLHSGRRDLELAKP